MKTFGRVSAMQSGRLEFDVSAMVER